VYCRLPDGLKGEEGFSVDHYRPQSKFPELVTTYSNLFYACGCCNRRKGAFWPANAQWQAKQFIPNPCEHVMFEHLRYRVARVETRGPTGEFAERVLMLNDEHSVDYREFVLSVIASLEATKRRIQETIRRIGSQCLSHPEQAERLSEEKMSAERDLEKLERHLNRVTGEVPL
jgi:hypothetical protein